jgi:hypothetical protein
VGSHANGIVNVLVDQPKKLLRLQQILAIQYCLPVITGPSKFSETIMSWQCRVVVMDIARLGILDDILDCSLYLRLDLFAGSDLVGDLYPLVGLEEMQKSLLVYPLL